MPESIEPRFHYEAFGLRIASQLELWPSASSHADVASAAEQCDAVVRITTQVAEVWSEAFELDQPIAALRWPRVGDLRVSHGRELCWRLEPTASQQSAALLSAGMGLAMLLSQRAKLVLHGASVVSPEGDARCLIGPSGAGKSSLVAALLDRGWSLLSDAMTVIEFDEQGRAWALRGVPFIRLWPDAIERAALRAEDFLRVTLEHDKRVVPVPSWSASPRAQLTRVYCLQSATEVSCSELRGAAAALALVPQHFLAELVNQPSSARLLADSTRAARSAAVYSLSRGQSPADIPRAADCV